MKIHFKGVFDIIEHLLILNRLKNETEGIWIVERDPYTQVPKVRRQDQETE